MKHTFNLTGEHTVTKGPRDKSWLASVTVDLSTLTTEMVERLAIHGLQQKVADAASGATTADEANASMSKARDAILAGEWTQRTGGGGVDEETAVARSIVKASLKANWGAKSEKWAEFTGLSDTEQAERLDTVRADNAELFQPAIDAKLADRARERADKAALSKKVTINI